MNSLRLKRIQFKKKNLKVCDEQIVTFQLRESDDSTVNERRRMNDTPAASSLKPIIQISE